MLLSRPIIFQAGTPCSCFKPELGLFAEGAALPKKELILNGALPNPIPIFYQPGLTVTDPHSRGSHGQAASEMMTGSSDEAAEEESCTLRLYFRLGSAALCWYIAPAELVYAVKPRTQLSFS